MNTNFKYVQATYEEALAASRKAGDYIESALSSANSVKGLEVSDSIASSFNSNLTKVKELSEKIAKIPDVFESWSDKIIQLNLDQMSADDPTGFYYVIKNIGNGYYKVFGMGEPMTVNAEGAKYLQEAINKMLSVCPGTYGNNGAKVGDDGTYGHSTGQAFDVQTNLGLRINYNGGGDVAYYAVNNKKTEISAYDIFYVTYDGDLADIFNNRKLTVKKAYLKVRPGTTIPSDMQKYIVNGLDNAIEVDDVEKSTPSLNNMHQTSLNGQYLDVSKLFAAYGWKQIGAYGCDTGKYQSIEWHHFQYDPSLLKESGVYVKDPDGSDSGSQEVEITLDYDLGEDTTSEDLDILTGDDEKFIDVSEEEDDTKYEDVSKEEEKPEDKKETEDVEVVEDDSDIDIIEDSTEVDTTVTLETIWTENGYTDSIPMITFGNNGTVYTNESENLVYGLEGVSVDNYNNYIELLKTSGYILDENGVWINEYYKISINYLDGQMMITIFKNID